MKKCSKACLALRGQHTPDWLPRPEPRVPWLGKMLEVARGCRISLSGFYSLFPSTVSVRVWFFKNYFFFLPPFKGYIAFLVTFQVGGCRPIQGTLMSHSTLGLGRGAHWWAQVRYFLLLMGGEIKELWMGPVPWSIQGLLFTDHNPYKKPRTHIFFCPPVSNALFKGQPIDRLHLSKPGSFNRTCLNTLKCDFLG